MPSSVIIRFFWQTRARLKGLCSTVSQLCARYQARKAKEVYLRVGAEPPFFATHAQKSGSRLR